MIFNVKLLKKETIAQNTMAFHFEKPEGFIYRAGQYADFTILDPSETDEEGNTRGFSFSSAPFENTLMAATRMRDTAFKRVLKDLPLGTILKLDASYGDFALHKTESIPAVFLIGGIGVTPVRSMIAQATHDKTAHKITLLHANRTPSEAAFSADFERFERENPNFRFVSIASDEVPETWTGTRGRIDEGILKKFVPDLKTPIFYLSGPEGMVKAMRSLLVTLDVNEDKIKTEEFSGY